MKQQFALAPIFRDNMMFQANKPIRIFGTCKKGVEITVVFLDEVVKFKSKSDEFLVEFEPVPVRDKGFSFSLFTKKQEITIYNCLIGDVYLFVGGKNAYMPLKESYHEVDYEDSEIRFLDMNKVLDKQLKYAFNPQWLIAGKSDLADFSALSFLFAKHMHQVTKSPIGIITCNHFNASIFSWLGAKEINSHIDMYEYVMKQPKELALHSSVFYDTMVSLRAPSSLKAIILYQGEDDFRHPGLYSVALQRIVQTYRTLFDDQALPFIITQIAGGIYPESDGIAISKIRLIQSAMMNDEKMVYVASAVDLGDEENNYVKEKMVFAKRLVNVVLEKCDRMTKNAISPMYYSHNYRGDEMVIFTHNNYLNLVSHSTKNLGFTYSSDGKNFKEITDIKLVNNQIVLYGLKNAVEVRYGYLDYPVCDIYTTNELPLLPFRVIV
ncbi:MAG TPA: sialate O-acetylesterase [Bacillota bacterium]|nr:sialate O-acetylesterase [Bacillota bacterium]